MDAARNRAQRRGVFMPKRRGDPQQSIQVIGSHGRMYRDDTPYQATQDQQGLKLDKILSSGGGVILELPCGLVEDSSVTVVGMPEGHFRSFQIEFIGSKLSGEPKLPIVLHYNVSLPGDNMTEEPFVTQNTWTNELGWGKRKDALLMDLLATSKLMDLLFAMNKL